MISYIKGVLREISKNSVIVETGNFGIEVFVPVGVLQKLPAIGKEVLLHTYFKVSEDGMSLYGFSSSEELQMFRRIISVNGVGPKSGLGVLSVLSQEELRMAIIREDVKTISQAPGIGAKTAKRIILDLKDKIGTEDILGNMDKSSFSPTDESAPLMEAIEALHALGYSSFDAANAVKSVKVEEGMGAEEILKSALKKLALL